MRILFLCGSLEPGRDGVGDYSRRLARQLSQNGHNVSLMAINDSYIQGVEAVREEQEGIPVYRFGQKGSYLQKLALKRAVLEEVNPEYLSLQFVLFSFQNKGLPLILLHELSALGKGKNWQIMFHELWVGLDKEARIPVRVWGLLQKILVRQILKSLDPKVVHTQSCLYLEQLQRLGLKNVFHLPLFGNIPVEKGEGIVCTPKPAESSSQLCLIFFGSLQPEAPIKDFILELSQYSRKYRKNIRVKFIGRNGRELEKWNQKLREENFEVEIQGEGSPEQISRVLSGSNYAISTTPLAQIEKSGTVACMLEHQLPVISVSRRWSPKSQYKVSIPSGVIEYTKGNLQDCFNQKVQRFCPNDISKISEIFINSLVTNLVRGT